MSFAPVINDDATARNTRVEHNVLDYPSIGIACLCGYIAYGFLSVERDESG